jgi:hypothetical protein
MKSLLVRLARRPRRKRSFRQAQGDPRPKTRILASLLRRAREAWRNRSQRLRSPQGPLDPKGSGREALWARALRYLLATIRLIIEIKEFLEATREIAELLGRVLQMLQSSSNGSASHLLSACARSPSLV